MLLIIIVTYFCEVNIMILSEAIKPINYNDPILKSIPVVAITADTVFGTEKKAKEDGCDGY